MTDPTSPDAGPLPTWNADEAPSAPGGSDSKRRLLLIVGILVGVLAVGAVAVGVSGVLDPDEKDWPAEVSGRPAGLGENGQTAADVTPSAEPGVYLWSGFDGWHLWVVNGEGVSGASGTLTSSHDLGEAKLSLPDGGSISVDGKELTFDLSADVPVTGVDFQPDFYAEEITLDVAGPDGPLDPSVVTLGTETPADALPVTVEKVAKD